LKRLERKKKMVVVVTRPKMANVLERKQKKNKQINLRRILRMNNLASAILMYLCLFGLSYWSMTAGWGLAVVSWPPIIFSFVGMGLITLVAEIFKDQ